IDRDSLGFGSYEPHQVAAGVQEVPDPLLYVPRFIASRQNLHGEIRRTFSPCLSLFLRVIPEQAKSSGR
ncbi:MAG: hypothetical protein ACT4P5_02060, partial [Armatimonadota bacterium]